jgi:hypothetical protein
LYFVKAAGPSILVQVTTLTGASTALASDVHGFGHLYFCKTGFDMTLLRNFIILRKLENISLRDISSVAVFGLKLQQLCFRDSEPI